MVGSNNLTYIKDPQTAYNNSCPDWPWAFSHASFLTFDHVLNIRHVPQRLEGRSQNEHLLYFRLFIDPRMVEKK